MNDNSSYCYIPCSSNRHKLSGWVFCNCSKKNFGNLILQIEKISSKSKSENLAKLSCYTVYIRDFTFLVAAASSSCQNTLATIVLLRFVLLRITFELVTQLSLRALDSHRTIMEEVKNGPWYFKQNEDGVFVKLNEERIKNKNSNLMEQVEDVRESPNSRGRENNHVVVSFFSFVRARQNWLL